MTKTYDPQYSTQVSFNTPILLCMVREKDITKISHWLNNAEPHKKLADAAFIECLDLNWIEGLDMMWDSKWLSNKSFISKGWMHIVCQRNDKVKNTITESEQWIHNKTFNENHLSKAEFNNLAIELLDRANYFQNERHWDLFISQNVTLKGKKSESLFWSLNYFRYFNDNNKNNSNQHVYPQDEVDFFQKCIDDVLKNGIQIEYTVIMETLIAERYELFWQIMNSPKIIMDKKDLFILATLISMYYKTIRRNRFKMAEDDSSKELDSILKALVGWGLTEKVTFAKKDILGDYNYKLKEFFGYFSLNQIPNFRYMGRNWAAQLPKINYKADDAVDVELFTGDAFFAEPDHKVDGYMVYGPLTEKQKAAYRELMKNYMS